MDLKETIAQLKSMTRTYLEMNGHNFNERGFCTCPNPAHTDSDPSCHFVPGTDVLRCFGCSWAGDMFHLAEWFEGLPRFGSDFLTITMVQLCERFSIPYEPPEMSEAELYRHKVFRAYKDAATVLISYPIADRVKDRGWTQETCERTFTGSVPSWDDFSERMRKLGYSATYLKEIDITSLIFNEHTIIFTWTNAYGAPVGFAARDTRYVEGGDNPARRSKYYNTGAKCSIFQKGSLLYGLSWARGHSPIVITEGYADVITPYQHGITNVVCLGGTSLTKQHVELLNYMGIDNITLALDPDEGGILNTVKALDDALSGVVGMRVRVLDLTGTVEGKADIDDFFKLSQDPIDRWKSLPTEDAFEWRLKHFSPDAEPAMVVEEALRLVVNEKSYTKREDMVRIIAARTNYNVETIQRDLDRLTYAERQQVKDQVEAISTGLVHKLKSNKPPDNVIEELIEAGKAVEGIRERAVGAIHNPSETVDFLGGMCVELLNPETRPKGFMSGLPGFDNMFFNGVPKMGRMISLAGEPSAGKTAFLHQLIWRFLLGMSTYEENKDILVLLLTIDDSRRVVMPRFMSIQSNLPTNDKILSPENCNPDETRRWKEARERLEYYIKYNYLDIRDAGQGITLDYFEDWIRYTRTKNPNRQILAILDNFHKLEGFGSDDRVKYKAISQQMHKLKTQLNVTFLCTMELIKTHGRDARADDIAETKKILYDCDALLHIHSDWQQDLGNTGSFWISETGVRKPVVKLRVWKNKISSKLPSLWYNMDPDTSRFIERDGPPDDFGGDRRAQELASLQRFRQQ